MSTLLRHWIVALPILLIAAALCIAQIDRFSSTADEFYSMSNAGWLEDGPYSPAQVLDALRQVSPDHMPGYYMLLGAWGGLAGTEIAMARTLTIFFSLLALSLVYRLARDHIAPEAGLFAIVIMASSAFYNMYLAHARMYPMLVCFSALTMWLYLRCVDERLRITRWHYLALGGAAFMLACTHAVSAKLLLVLGIYHLLFVKKDRRWWLVSLTVSVGVLLLTPWLLELIPNATAVETQRLQGPDLDWLETLRLWSKVSWNAQFGLLAIAAAGMALGKWMGLLGRAPFLPMALLFALVLALMGQFGPAMAHSDSRAYLDGYPLTALFTAGGLYALFLYRRWLGWLLLLWPLAGLHFQAEANWEDYIAQRRSAFQQAPWHLISRLARQQEPYPIIFGYRYKMTTLRWSGWLGYSYRQRDHYFERYGITLARIDEPEQLADFRLPRPSAGTQIWFAHPPQPANSTVLDAFDAAFRQRGFQPCGQLEARADTLIRRYCIDGESPLASQTESLDYQFFAAEHDAESERLIIVDRWQPLDGKSLEFLSISLQLIDAHGDKLAQMDRPMARRGLISRFFMDIEALPPGQYTLVAIVYNYETGQRHDWRENADADPGILRLAEILIPAP